MARKTDIRLRRSNTANAIPTSGNLSLGEMAMNTADGALYFKTSDNTVITAHDNTIMHIDSLNDRVGIGTTTPLATLHVGSAAGSLNSSAELFIPAGDALMRTLKIGHGSSTASITTDDSTKPITFTAGGSEKVRIDTSGRVGIGITSPSSTLHVDSGTNDWPIKAQSADAKAGIILSDNNTTNYLISESYTLSLGNQASLHATNLNIKSTGNVGIGTTTPGEKLEVVGNVEAEEFIGDLRGALLFKAQAGEALSKGDVVYISGISGNTTVVSKADADDSAKMPAFGVVAAAATLNSAVDIYTFGTLSGIDTSSYSEGDELYVSTTAGALTSTAPTGSGSLIQKIAKVTRSDASAGSIKVIGAGRTNAVPNLDQYKIFVGNSSNQAVQGNNALTVDIDNNAVGINTGDPDAYVSSLGAGLHIATDVVLNSNTPLLYLRANGGSAMSEIRYQNSLKFTNGSATLHGFIDSAGRLTFGNATNFSDANADDFQIGNTSGAHGISIVAQNSHNASIYFADNDNNDAGRIIYNHTNNRMEFYTNRSQRMVITSAGNVGIGTNAAAEKLEVSGGHIKITNTGNTNLYINANNAGSDATIFFEEEDSVKAKIQHDASNDSMLFTDGALTDTMTLKSGRVGIGTTSPTGCNLHIAEAGDPTILLEDTDSSNQVKIRYKTTTTEWTAGLHGGVDKWKIAKAAGFGTNDYLVVDASGRVGIGTDSPQGTLHLRDTTARLYVQSDDGSSAHVTFGDATDVSRGGIEYTSTDDLVFSNNNFAERMRIRYTGDIGIGTALPGAKLDIAGASATDSPTLRLTGTGEASQGDTVGEIQFYNSDTTDFTPGVMSSIRAIAGASGGEGQLQIYTNMPSEGTAAATLAAHFASDGNTIFGGTSVGAAGAMSVKVDGTYTDLYLYGAGTSQGGRIFFGDSSDRSSITGTYGTGGGGKLSFKTDTTGGTSQDRLVIDSDGSIRFNNAFTFPTSIGSAGQVLKVPSTGSTLVWSNDAGGGSATVLTDTDGDTKIQVEESADEDIIRFDIAGTEQMVLNSTGLTVAGNLTVNGTQTVLNTSTLSVDDLNITIADGAANAAAANGAGITVDGANATLTYTSAQDEWNFNKNLVVGGKETTASFPLMVKSNTAHQGLHIEENSGAESWQMGVDVDGDLNFYNSGSTTPSITFDDSNNVGIGEQPRFKVSIKTPAIPSGSTYAWPLDLSRPNTENRGLTFGIAASGTTNAIAGHNADVSIGHTYGTDSNGLPQYYETLRVQHIDQSVGRVGIGTTSPDALLDLEGSFEGNSNFALKFTNTMGTGAVGGFRSHGVNGEHLTMYQEGARKQSWGETEVLFYGASDAEIVRFKNDGKVGIGTNSPLDLLHIKSTSTDARQVIDGHTGYDAELKFAENGTVVYTIGHNAADDTFRIGTVNVDTNPRLVITSAGNIGIGTTSPTSRLEVHGAVGIIPNTTNSSLQLRDTTALAANNGGSIVFSGIYDSSGGFLGSGPYIKAYKLNATSGDYSYGLKFATRENGVGSQVIGLTITPDQKVGIGTTNPGAKLHVVGSGTIGWSDLSNAYVLAGTTSYGIGFDNNELACKGTDLYFGTITANTDLIFRAGGTTQRMFIDGSNGNISIGTNTSPKAKLQVEEYGVDTSSTTTTATTQVAIHTFPIADFRTARFTIQITNTTDSTYHSTEIIAVHDGTTANITEFGEVHTGTSVEATFDADISSSNFRLLATPASTDSMTFKVVCHSITV